MGKGSTGRELRCGSGHALRRMQIGMGPGQTGAPPGAHACDRCDVVGLKEMVWRCEACDYDVCPSCATQGRGGYSGAQAGTAARPGATAACDVTGEMKVTILVVKSAGGKLGAKFDAPSTKLLDVKPGGPLAICGAGRYIGWSVTEVGGAAVDHATGCEVVTERTRPLRETVLVLERDPAPCEVTGEMKVTILVVKSAGGKLGAKFDEPSTKLLNVKPGGPLAICGAGRYVGWSVTEVGGAAVDPATGYGVVTERARPLSETTLVLERDPSPGGGGAAAPPPVAGGAAGAGAGTGAATGAASSRFVTPGAGADGGETNAPTVGRCYLRACMKGWDWLGDMLEHEDNLTARASAAERRESWEATAAKLVADFRALGFTGAATLPRGGRFVLCDLLEERLRAAERVRDARPRAEARWAALAFVYSLEQSGHPAGKTVYGDLNWCGRMDDPRVALYGRYVQGLLVDDPRFGFCSPASARPSQPQTLWRGVTMPAACAEKYPEGRRFMWCHFVSMTKHRGVADAFKARGEGDEVPFLFQLDCPAYSDRSRLWDLGGASAFGAAEGEVLAPPFTEWVTVGAPRTDDAGVVHVHLRAAGQAMRDGGVRICTVIVLPDGFARGSEGLRLARHAFHHGAPAWRFHDEEDDHWGPVYGRTAALALFTDPGEAAEWMAAAARRERKAFFRVLTSGAASRPLLARYFATDTVAPCEVKVYCRDAERWRGEYADFGRVSVTADAAVARAFLVHEHYDGGCDAWKRLREPSARCEGEYDPEDRYCYFWRREGRTGIVYGDAGKVFRDDDSEDDEDERDDESVPVDPAHRASALGLTTVDIPLRVASDAQWRALLDGERLPMRPFDA